MKGGNDMQRIFNFEENDDAYEIFFEDKKVYTINKETLKVDGTKFYETFFSEYLSGDILELKQGDSLNMEDKISIAVYDNINKLLIEIMQKIEELKETLN